ncbi:hypothetical protein [Streptomyces formicae]|uniref:1-deoxy-D-xylulose-5-phosphate synthase n=1 Tax=Streptomyces formicae TaxID=1616117 RepID=A0A291Q273_9ACTN|nr:hypothetical protein [Streptomyces formicae]ATL25586.1 1-deoxy-D-xylulose 5-phosphate synthase [Streptomyces formicae]
MATKFPGRVFDVGIAEQHAATSAVRLAMGGYQPVVALYATLLNRAFDQVLMDVALHQPTFVLDRADVTDPDGPSHHGMWDLTALAAVPGMRIAAPRAAAQLQLLLSEALDAHDGPTALRLPKAGAGAGIRALARVNSLYILHRSTARPLDVLLVPAGPLERPALEATGELEEHGISVAVVGPRWLLPINSTL